MKSQPETSLSDVGVTKQQPSRWQSLARLGSPADGRWAKPARRLTTPSSVANFALASPRSTGDPVGALLCGGRSEYFVETDHAGNRAVVGAVTITTNIVRALRWSLEIQTPTRVGADAVRELRQ
jgi:hypothetical protein